MAKFDDDWISIDDGVMLGREHEFDDDWNRRGSQRAGRFQWTTRTESGWAEDQISKATGLR